MTDADPVLYPGRRPQQRWPGWVSRRRLPGATAVADGLGEVRDRLALGGLAFAGAWDPDRD